jgi:DNA-binding CsgD family transcriptional regulator
MIAPDENRLLSAIEALYAAALGIGTWTGALARIGDTVGADHLFLHAQSSTQFFFAAARIDERDLARALAARQEIEPDMETIEGLAAGEVLNRASFITDREYLRSPHYNELVRPLGGFHGLLGRLGAPALGSSLVLCRAPHQTNFRGGNAETVRALLPHVGMAIDIAAKVQRASETVRSFESVLEGVVEAVVVCDRSRRPLFANAAAQRLLANGDGLAFGGAGLFCSTPDDTGRLRAAIALAEAEGQARLRLPRRSGRPPLMLRIMAVGDLARAAGPGSVAIFIAEPDAARAIDRDAIAEAFGLTRREAEIAALLAAGSNPAAIAAELELGLGSVRVYLTRIFNKTDARSQASLVSMLRGFV